MKKILLVLIACVACLFHANAQQIAIQLWGDNAPVTFQCHTESDGGDYGKMISEQQLEFWESENGGIDMRQSFDVTYSKGRCSSGAYIYHGKRQGNKIVFTTYEDGDAMDETADVVTIDPSYQAFELEIISPKQVKWDRCIYNKMIMDFSKGQWVRE